MPISGCDKKLELCIDGNLLLKRIDRLSRIGRTAEGGVTRPGFSVQESQARNQVRRWMEEAGLETRLDPALNLIGTCRGKEKGCPAIVTGSHLDSVPNGGKLDGALGVLGALEAVRSLIRSKVEIRRGIKVIAFVAEEPNPYGLSTVGSRVLSNSLPEGALDRKDPKGVTLSELLSRRGGRPEEISKASFDPSQVGAFVELHIEQGPFLEIQNIPIGIVSTLCGIKRLLIEVKGRPDHAGTTPMNLRKDALAAGAQLILAIETICKSRGEGMVGTVGKMTLTPNQVNVVPGRAELELDLRASDVQLFEKIQAEILEACDDVANQRGLEITLNQRSAERPVSLPEDLSRLIRSVCQDLGLSYLKMPSWAGHDANRMAKITKTAVIFVPSRQGLSHCPQEWTEEKDIEAGVRVLSETLLRLANQ